MLLIILGCMLFIAGASQRWQPAIRLNQSNEKRPLETEEAQWVRQTYAANMMRAGTLLFTCGAAISFVSL